MKDKSVGNEDEVFVINDDDDNQFVVLVAI